jgi:hypothetical protein
LDTTGAKWVAACFVDGFQPPNTSTQSPNIDYTYASNPSILAVGPSQDSGVTVPSAFTWVGFTLTASPIVIGQQPVSANVDAGAAFTNTVVVAATNASYLWFNNGVPITGATNASLIFNPVTVANGGTNYYVVITNILGTMTSSVASLTVFTNPVVMAAYPVAYTNPLTLFYGANVGGSNYVGSSPTFSVSALGQVPLAYQWQTNGVAMGGATNASFSITNCQLSSPTNFACVVSNSYGKATNAWLASYVQTPLAPYPQQALAYQPVGYWRLDEWPDDQNGDDGVLALDSAGGNNGIYTNAYFIASTYSTITDPNETAVDFSAFAFPSAAYGIQGINFAAPTNNSVSLSVAAWVNASSAAANAGIVAKGYLNAEQFVLTESGGKYVFTVHSAVGTLYSATAAVGPNGTWQHVVGVCNEAAGAGNTNLTIYVNGLQSGKVLIPSGSGLLAASVPMTIGARSTSATTGYDLQFGGELDDVTVFNYALSAAQVATLYAASGNAVPLSFVAPLPPTNVVYQANTTVPIPATVAAGAPPVGYYWTNLTAGGAALLKGGTNAYGNVNVSLTLTNAASSLSGDQLELVVTNSISFTNWLVNLFSPAPPVTLSYTNPILYSNIFNGGTWTIGGQPLTAANFLVGGTNTTWVDVLGANDAGSIQASGADASTSADSWLWPFTPHSGYVYTLTGSFTFISNPGSWVAVGFAQAMPVGPSSGAFNNGNINGYDWILLNESSGNAEYFAGPLGNISITNENGFIPAGPGTHAMTTILDATGTQWVISANIDGTPAGTYTYPVNPPIGAAGISQYTVTVPANIQWNDVSLTQVAPGGVPPYLLAALSTNSISLTNTTVTIPATGFGSGPLGYFWSNNSNIIGAGSTNSMAPLPASLSVTSSSLSAGQLELVVTNAYGTNITLIALTSATTIPTNKPTITGFSIVEGTNVMITATNGQSAATYYLLGSTNLTTPLSQWLPLATNVIVTNGGFANGFTFTGTNVVPVSVPQEFYFLSNTN